MRGCRLIYTRNISRIPAHPTGRTAEDGLLTARPRRGRRARPDQRRGEPFELRACSQRRAAEKRFASTGLDERARPAHRPACVLPASPRRLAPSGRVRRGFRPHDVGVAAHAWAAAAARSIRPKRPRRPGGRVPPRRGGVGEGVGGGAGWPERAEAPLRLDRSLLTGRRCWRLARRHRRHLDRVALVERPLRRARAGAGRVRRSGARVCDLLGDVLGLATHSDRFGRSPRTPPQSSSLAPRARPITALLPHRKDRR